MKLRDKIKSYSFWVSLTSAIILILKILGTRFGFAVDETMISDLFTALCSILVLLGIIVPPQNISTATVKQITENKNYDNYQQVSIVTESNSKESENKNNSILAVESNQQPPETISNNQECEEVLDCQPEVVSVEISTSENNDVLTVNQKVENLTTSDNSPEESNENNDENFDLKQMFFDIKEKFSGNLDSYIFELQEEIRKTREGM